MNDILKRLAKTAAICMLTTVGIWVYARFNGCIIRQITGIPCPSCGMSRAVFSVASLHFHEAFYYHPLVYLFLPLVGYLIFKYVFYGIYPTDKRYRKVYITTLIIYLAVWIVRLVFFKIP